MIKSSPTLIEAIDGTAFKLLRKIGGDSTLTPEESALFPEQVKAFGEVVKWAQARTGLLPKDDKPKDSKFVGLKHDFHAAGAKSGGRRNPGKDTPALGSAAILDFPDTSTDSSPDSDEE